MNIRTRLLCLALTLPAAAIATPSPATASPATHGSRARR